MFGFLSRIFRRPERDEECPTVTQSDDQAIGVEAEERNDSSSSVLFARPSAEALYSARVEYSPLPPVEIQPVHDFHKDGLPPDWTARRDAVIRRDDVQCQVTGCINTDPTCLDVHHIKPRFVQADHRLENLVTLCRLHHALLPFHRRAAENFNSDRYTSVSAHWKWNVFRTHRFPVRATIRHRKRVVEGDLSRIKDRYGLACSCCRSPELRVRIYQTEQTVRIRCNACENVWLFEQGLHEEIAPELASVFTVTRNEGTFAFDLDYLPGPKAVHAFTCSECATEGKVSIMQPRKGDFGMFWGCPNWNGHSGHYTRPWGTDDEQHVWKWIPSARKPRTHISQRAS